MNDPIQQLRIADPARRVALDSMDPSGWAALRDGTPMTSRTAADPADQLSTPAPAPRRKWRRAHTIATVTVIAVAATAAAAATYIPGFFGGNGSGAVNCMTVWGDQDSLLGGPLITGDPVADCAVYWEKAGITTPDDPVAFTYANLTYVTPADQVPDGVTLLEIDPALAAAEQELRLSLFDSVDGGDACRSIDDGAAWAQSELDRLGLADTWTIDIIARNTDPEWSDGIERPCASFLPSYIDKTVSITPMQDPSVSQFPDGNPRADYLRENITNRCLTVDEAEAVVNQMLTDRGENDGMALLNKVVDESASCARVDLAIGGGIEIAVYGPTSVTDQ